MAEVIGAIRDKWLRLGGEGFSGPALDVERPTFDGVGRAQNFRNGVTISWHPQIGEAFAVWGAIGEKWRSLGREQFGYPGTDETGRDGRGRFNHFRAMQLPGGPPSSVYWTPQTGAHEVHGAIREAWKKIGYERSLYGYPITDEFGPPDNRRSNFEHGFITWTPQGGPRLHPPVVQFDDGTALNPVSG